MMAIHIQQTFLKMAAGEVDHLDNYLFLMDLTKINGRQFTAFLSSSFDISGLKKHIKKLQTSKTLRN